MFPSCGNVAKLSPHFLANGLGKLVCQIWASGLQCKTLWAHSLANCFPILRALQCKSMSAHNVPHLSSSGTAVKILIRHATRNQQFKMKEQVFIDLNDLLIHQKKDALFPFLLWKFLLAKPFDCESFFRTNGSLPSPSGSGAAVCSKDSHSSNNQSFSF